MTVAYACPICGRETSLPDYVADKIDHPETTCFISCSHKGRVTTAKPAAMRRKEQRETSQSAKEATSV
jgi:ribosome-binding protein aMBF1 (putative translation factor)